MTKFAEQKLAEKHKSSQRLEVLLYNAISLLADETISQYNDTEEWFSNLLSELGCTAEELKEYGIIITPNGEISTI